MKCPKCSADLAITAKTAEREIVRFEIAYENDLLEAKAVHGMMAAAERLIISTGKEHGVRLQVYLHSIEQGEGRVEFALLVVQAGPASTPKRRGAK